MRFDGDQMSATLADGVLAITFRGGSSDSILEWASLDGAQVELAAPQEHHEVRSDQARQTGLSDVSAVRVRVADVTDAEFKDASLVGKGAITIHVHDKIARFHFRRKTRSECLSLYEEIVRQSGAGQPENPIARLNAFGSEDRAVARDQMATSTIETPMQFEGLFLNGEDFSGRKLVGANFRDAHLRGCSFAQADLTGAIFVDADLERANLAECELAGADFSDAILTDAEFSGANLAAARLDGIIASLVGMAGANLAGASLVGACVEGGDFTGANLQTASLLDAEIEGADFTGADFSGATMPDGSMNP